MLRNQTTLGDGAGRQMFRQTVMVGMPMPSVLSMMFWRLFTDNQIDVYDANSIIEVAKEVVTAHRTATLARMQANGPYNGLNYGTLPSLSPSSTMASFATNVSIPPPTTTELEGIMHAIANNN